MALFIRHVCFPFSFFLRETEVVRGEKRKVIRPHDVALKRF